MNQSSIFHLAAPKGASVEPPPSSQPILSPSYELHPSFIAMVQEQSFTGEEDENPYTHLSIPKQRESSMAKSPPLPSKDCAIDPEPQIKQISKEEEINHLNLSFDYKANLLSNLSGFGNALNSSKLASCYASSSHVVHQEKSKISDELPQGMSSEPI